MDHVLNGRKMVEALCVMASAIGRTGFSLTQENVKEDKLLLDLAIELDCPHEFLSLLSYRKDRRVAACLKAVVKMGIHEQPIDELGLGVASMLPQFEWRTDNYHLFRKELIAPNKVRVTWQSPETVLPTEVREDWYFIANCDEMEYVTRAFPFPEFMRVVRPHGKREAIVQWCGEMVETV